MDELVETGAAIDDNEDILGDKIFRINNAVSGDDDKETLFTSLSLLPSSSSVDRGKNSFCELRKLFSSSDLILLRTISVLVVLLFGETEKSKSVFDTPFVDLKFWTNSVLVEVIFGKTKKSKSVFNTPFVDTIGAKLDSGAIFKNFPPLDSFRENFLNWDSTHCRDVCVCLCFQIFHWSRLGNHIQTMWGGTSHLHRLHILQIIIRHITYCFGAS